MSLGIESIHAYVGRASIGVRRVFAARGLDMSRFSNLMMEEKSVNLPWEDPVTNGVNAAKPLVDALSDDEKERIEAVIVGTESGLDFGKPISTYIQQALGLGPHCRSFEVKHACYGGTAALRTAAGLLQTGAAAGAKALVVATDVAAAAARNTYWEPSQGAGAVAMVVGEDAGILELDSGAAGFYSQEVMDTCRPQADIEAGDSDLSLLSYLQALDQCYAAYRRRVAGADLESTFDYLVFHTPFAGMVRGAHRALMRKHSKAAQQDMDEDFERRVMPSLAYCRRVGNVYSAALYLALCSLIDHGAFESPKRLGIYSYGSGCAAEFYSGVAGPQAQARLRGLSISGQIDRRHGLPMEQYEAICEDNLLAKGGVRDLKIDTRPHQALYEDLFAGQSLLVLRRVESYHRVYEWS